MLSIMNTDNEQIHLIEVKDDLQLPRTLDWLGLQYLKDVSGTSQQSGSMTAKTFCDCPDLLNELMFIGADGDYLIHDRYQMVDAKVHIRVYYTDGRDYYDRRFIYHFHDQKVDQVQVNNIMQPAKGWRVEGAIGNQVHINYVTQQTMGW